MLCERCSEQVPVPRTEKQREILEYYRDFLVRKGFKPSYAQMARHLGLRSKATIAGHMQSLKLQGFVK
jgi:repressor LexA